MLHLVQQGHKVLVRVLLAQPHPLLTTHGTLDCKGADVAAVRSKGGGIAVVVHGVVGSGGVGVAGGGAVAVGGTVHDDGLCGHAHGQEEEMRMEWWCCCCGRHCARLGLCGHAHGQEEEMRNGMVALLPWAALCTIRVVWACTWTGGGDEKWNGGAVAVGCTVHDDGLCGHAHGQEEEMRNGMVALLPWAALCMMMGCVGMHMDRRRR